MTASPSKEQSLYDALKRIAAYQKPERLSANAERDYGVSAEEAIEMAYENVLNEAAGAIRGMRRPKK